MHPSNIDSLFDQAVELHRQGRMAEALALYDAVIASDLQRGSAHFNRGLVLQSLNRADEALHSFDRAILIEPDKGDAHYCRAVTLRRMNRLDEAVESYDRAVALMPDFADAYFERGNVLQRLDRFEESLASYDRVIALKPDLAEAYNNKGSALRKLKQPEEALGCFDRAIALKPDYAEPHNSKGLALQDLERHDQALQSFDRAIALKSDFPQAYNNRGLAMKDLGRWDEALVDFEKAIALKPDFAEAHCNKGLALTHLDRFAEAIESFDRAIALKPDYAEAHSNLGNTLAALGKLVAATESYRTALDIKPHSAETQNNMGIALAAQGKLAEAIESYIRALDLKPDYADANSNLLMALHYSANFSNAEIFASARQFAARFDKPAAPMFFANDPTTDRRLRIGYVSGDFCNHPVGFFLARVLPSHDRSAVEVFCYSNSDIRDQMTDRLRGAADHWRRLAGVSDADAARLIQQDRIDILVDLSGHTALNRLRLFALRPAPVQVSWLGYFDTTGLTTIDYILADDQVVRKGDERYYSEKVWRLPGCYLCYAPPSIGIAVAPPPTASNGFVTFGCFNNRAKITPATIEVWARVLSNVTGSRLFLKAKSFADPAACQDLRDRFAVHGVAANRLLFEGYSSLPETLSAYHRVDIALDPFPFGGCTTTADTLWMGVPVVTHRGDRWVGRMSATILSAIGHPELVAESLDDYVEIATALAADLSRLTEMHAGLRPQLENSPFCDGPGFTRHLEAAYRAMWRAWCESAVQIGEIFESRES